MNVQNEINRLQEMLNLRNSNQDPPVDLYYPEGSDDYTEVPFDDEQILRQHNIAHVTPPAYTPSLPFLATMEPTYTLLMGDEVISITPKRENDEFVNSSVDDLVPIPRESEVTSVYDDLECDMPITIPFPTTDVREEDFDINSPLGEHVVDFLMENEDVAGLPRHLVKQLFSHLLKNPSLTKGMSDEPLGDDSKPRSYEVTFSNPLLDFNDAFTLFIDESSLLVTPLPDPKQICLKEVERFDLFFSLTQLRGTKRVMETPSSGFHHMPSPRLAAYSPKEVMTPYDLEDLRAYFQSFNYSVSDHLHVYV
ncbi:hypothetical protein Tco_1391634 [Tanacetum coccineum]